MQACETEGRYAGFLTKMALGRTTGGCVQLMADCELRAEFDEEKNAWVPLQGAPQEIFGRIILTKRSGEVNGYQYGVLKGALDWDGKNIEDLQTRDFSKVKVAVHVEEDTYQGNTSLKVAFISALDWTPGVSKATGKELDDIKAAWAATKSDEPDPSEALPPSDDLGPDSDIPF